MKNLLVNILGRLKALWAAEPALVITAVVSAIVFVCTKVGIVVDQQSLATAVAYILPILLGGVAVRQNVSPVKDPSYWADPTDRDGANDQPKKVGA